MTGTRSGSRSASDVSAGESTASIVREGLNTAPINITAAEGAVVSVDVPQNDTRSKVATQGKQTSETEEESSWFSKKRLPLTLAIVFFGIGLIVLFYAVKLWRASFKSVDVAIGAADTTVAGGIHMIESWLAASTDPNENAKLSALKSHFEKGRGQLNRKK